MKKTVKILCFVLAVVLLFGACGKTPATSSTPTEQSPSASSNDTVSTEPTPPTPADTALKPTPDKDIPAGLTLYPALSDEIGRDYDYTVHIAQGDFVAELPVYNASTASNYFESIIDGDIHRRYCEFAFDGSQPVTVQITVHMDMKSYTVMPSSRKIPSTVSGNVITYQIDKPQTTLLKINDDRDTILTIFAEAPETDIPDKNDENVVYFEKGYHEVEGGVIALKSGQTLYLEPGAVVKARVSIVKADNVKICGRGAFLEPSPNRMAVSDVSYMCWMTASNNITINDVRFLEAHTFNIVNQGTDNLKMNGVKVLSNQISTDGLSFWSRNGSAYVTDCYWHIGDDVFVNSGDCTSERIIENCIVGSDYGIFTLGGHYGGTITFRNMEVFRAGALFKCMGATTLGEKASHVITENINATDATDSYAFFNSDEFCDLERTFVIKNFAAPVYPRATMLFNLNGEKVNGTTVTVENLWFGDMAFTTFDNMITYRFDSNGNTLTFAGESNKDLVNAGYINETKAAYTAEKVYIAGQSVSVHGTPFADGDTRYIPAREVLEMLGFDVRYQDGIFTFKDDNVTYSLTVGSTAASGEDATVTLSKAPVDKNGIVYLPLSVFDELLGLKATYDVGIKRTLIENYPRSGNLLKNPGMEEGLTTDWPTRHFTFMYLSEDAHSGKYAMRTRIDASSYQPGSQNGIYQDVAEILRRYGAGTYKLGAWIKATPESEATLVRLGFTRYFTPEKTYTEVKPTTSWQYVEYELTVSADMANCPTAYFYIGDADGTVKEFIVDDLSFEKIA